MTKKKTQTILIPKGTINPNEDTLIEIPTGLKSQAIVIAKKPEEYQENTISIENKSSKNVEFQGDKYIVSEDQKIKIRKQQDKSIPPRQESDDSFYDVDDSDTVDNAALERKFEEMQRAKKELEESAMFATAPSHLSNMSFQNSSSAVGRNETNLRPRRSSACPSAFKENKSLQYKPSKPQNDTCPGSTSRRHQSTTSVADRSCSFNQEGSRFNSSKRSDGNVSFVMHDRSGISEDFEESDDTPACPPKMDKETSVLSLNKSYSKSCKPSAEDKEVQPSTLSKYEKRESDPPLPYTKKPRENCERCESLLSKKPSPVERGSRRSRREDLEDNREKLSKMYKDSDNTIDEIYIQQLKRQFEEAKRKLEEAVMLASISLNQMGSKKYPSTSRKMTSGSPQKTASICDAVPERDISFISVCGNKPSCVVYVPGPSQNPCPVLNQADNSWPRDDYNSSETYKNNDIYKNIVTRKSTDYEPRKSPVQYSTDSPCPFLKKMSSYNSTPRSFKVSKDTNTQTDLKLNPVKPKAPTQEALVQANKASVPRKSSSKCSSGCSSGMQRCSSIKVVKEPKCNFSDSESLVGKTSTFLSKCD